MTAYDAGYHSAGDELDRLTTTPDARRLAASEMLDRMSFGDADEFDTGYRARLAFAARRLCRHCSTIFDVPNRWACCPACLDIEYRDGEDYTILDESRVYPMVDGYHIHTLIGSEGTERLYVVDSADVTAPCKGYPIPDHERLGPLPMKVRADIWRRARCGRPTRSGRPCRNASSCHIHRRGSAS